MDFRRANRHFRLSQDPRQFRQPAPNQQDADAYATQENPVTQASTQDVTQDQPQALGEVPQQESSVEEVEFLPPPPEVPALVSPTAESMLPQESQEPVSPGEVTQTNIPVEPIAAEQVVASAAPQPAQKPVKTKPDASYVPTKFVIVGAIVFLVILAGSVGWQQMTISQLKKERQLQSEQLKVVNPISVGAGASKD